MAGKTARRGRPVEQRDNLGNPLPAANSSGILCFRVNYAAAQTDTAAITVGATERCRVTSIMATVAASTSVDVSIIIGFGAANTPTGAGVLASHPGMKATVGGGFHRHSGGAPIGIGAAGEDVRVTMSVPTGGSVDIDFSYELLPA